MDMLPPKEIGKKVHSKKDTITLICTRLPTVTASLFPTFHLSFVGGKRQQERESKNRKEREKEVLLKHLLNSCGCEPTLFASSWWGKRTWGSLMGSSLSPFTLVCMHDWSCSLDDIFCIVLLFFPSFFNC